MIRWILCIALLAAGVLIGVRAFWTSSSLAVGAPIVAMELIEMPAQDIDGFVADWNKHAAVIRQAPGHITTTLYRSLLAGVRYQLIQIAQWQSLDAWANSQGEKSASTAIYRPAAWSTNTYADLAAHEAHERRKPLERVQKDPEITFPEWPFMFINLMEINPSEVDSFVSDWRIRSKVMGQMPAAMGSTLYRSVHPDQRFQIVNVSQWQSYDGFIDANNNPDYAEKLESDLGHVPSIKLLRGFYRPVATQTHTYGDAREDK